jgi:hypothetical protein
MMRGLMLSIGIAGVVCVDVRIGESRYLDCLNEMFRATAKPAVPGGSMPNPAATPAPAAGVYNQAATREMLGHSFGHSVIPARPPQPGYARSPR